MSDTYLVIQVKLNGLLYTGQPQASINLTPIANDVLRQVIGQLGFVSDQYGQPEGLSASSAVNDEAAHGVQPTVTHEIVGSAAF